MSLTIVTLCHLRQALSDNKTQRGRISLNELPARTLNIKSPLLTVESVVFTYHERTLKVLLVERSTKPEKGLWGLPGGIVDPKVDQDLEAAAVRKLVEKTGVEPKYLDQLSTLGNDQRDPRGWSVTIVYTALIAYKDCAQTVDTLAAVKWVPIDEISSMTLAFDHAALISAAQARMKQRALYSIAPGYALPDEFTFGELQHLHEVLIGKAIQKRSFRRRIEQADLLLDTGEKRQESGRPAKLYKLKEVSKVFTFVRNLESE